MIIPYLRSAYRSIFKHKAYSVINVVSLAVGMVCCLLIALYVSDELGYDHYHEKADRLYKLVMETKTPEGESSYALTPAPLGEALVRDFPEVETSTRLFTLFGNAVVTVGDKSFVEDKVFFADSTFFDVFTVPLAVGDPSRALAEPNSVVLSATMAQKYFGSENPIGRTLRINSSFSVTVTAVMTDIRPDTHFHADFLISLASAGFSRNPSFISNNNFNTYVVLRPGSDPNALEAKLPQVFKRYAAAQIADRYGQSYEEQIASGFETRWSLIPVTDIHLHSHRQYEIEPNGSAETVYAFAAVALFVLLIACANFVNLATARSASRAREIAVRKVVGSKRTQLLIQFLLESSVLTVIALVVAVVAVELVLPGFDALSGKHLAPGFLLNPIWIFSLAAGAVVVTLVAGLYPAMVLSSFRPAAMLKGSGFPGERKRTVRSVLVVFQFAVSIALIAGTLIVQRQLGFLSGRDLGFDKEQVLVIQRAYLLGSQRDMFKGELRNDPHTVNIGASSTIPGRLFGQSSYRDEHSETSYALHEAGVDAGFIPTLRIDLVAGRNFSDKIASDSSAVILNQAAAKLFGWNDPLGKRLAYPGSRKAWRGTVVGVVKDFNFQSLHDRILPLVMFYQPSQQYITVRLKPQELQESVQRVEALWKKLVPQQPLQFSFLDRDFDALYRADQRTGTILSVFTLLAIAIACLGQVGLVAFIIERRTKEIGVRKVLGASTGSVVGLLSKDFVLLIVGANVIAWPIVLYAMSRWLEQFAYRIEIHWWILAAAGMLALLVAMLTVSIQSIRAARANPVDALRYE